LVIKWVRASKYRHSLLNGLEKSIELIKLKMKELKRHYFFISIYFIYHIIVFLTTTQLFILTNYTKDFGIGLNHRNPKMLLKKNINYH
jgi:hypothetical protein